MPYWRISAFYLLFFAGLGSFLPYWSLYLESLGFSPPEIGGMLGLVAATKIFAPSVAGWLADRSGRRVRWIRLMAFAAAAAFGGVLLGDGFWPLFWSTGVFSFFWNACLPLFEAQTLSDLGSDLHRYSRIRLWGSVGFIAAVGGLGYALDRVLEIGCIPWLIWVLLLALWWSSLSVPGAPSVLDEAEERFWPIVWRREVLAFFGVVMLLQLSHGPYYAFFSIHLASQGFASDRIGQLWVLAVLAEIALFLFAHRLFRRYTSRRILLTSLLLAAVRWVLIAAAAGNLIVLVVAQTLHAASFGAVHAVGVQLTHRYFTGRHGSKGQGLYSSASFGLGGALGAWGAGASWIPLGPAAVYAAAAGCCLLAAWIGWMWVDREPVRRWTRADSPLL